MVEDMAEPSSAISNNKERNEKRGKKSGRAGGSRLQNRFDIWWRDDKKKNYIHVELWGEEEKEQLHLITTFSREENSSACEI